jgi:hypothetical protein
MLVHTKSPVNEGTKMSKEGKSFQEFRIANGLSRGVVNGIQG